VHDGDDHATHRHLALEEVRALEERILARMHDKGAIRKLEERYEKPLTRGQRVADAFAALVGSWRFIATQSALLAIWIALNVIGWLEHWDPYPFIFLNLVLSFESAYAGPIIMMSQNRQEDRDRQRANLDLETNLRAEALIEELKVGCETMRQHQKELLELQRRHLEVLGAPPLAAA